MSKNKDEVNKNDNIDTETSAPTEETVENTVVNGEDSEEVGEENAVGDQEVPTAEMLLIEAGTKIEALTKQIKEQQDQYLRLRAEFENFRKRALSEGEQQRVKGIKLAIESFFPSMDGIDKALTMCKDDASLKGIQLVRKQFENALLKIGVEEIDPMEKPFDPEYHNAILNEVNPEKAGLVTEVFQKGYKYKDTLLRPAMVKVGIDE